MLYKFVFCDLIHLCYNLTRRMKGQKRIAEEEEEEEEKKKLLQLGIQ
jgi:hypothetical protein